MIDMFEIGGRKELEEKKKNNVIFVEKDKNGSKIVNIYGIQPKEVAKIHGESYNAVYAWYKRKRLEGFKAAGHLYFKTESLMMFLKGSRKGMLFEYELMRKELEMVKNEVLVVISSVDPADFKEIGKGLMNVEE